MAIATADPSYVRIGLISDTHGLLRPQALDALRGVDHIIHAGDIGNASVLETLARIAPLTAVRGNNDTGEWAQALPDAAFADLGGTRIHVLHDIKDLGKYADPADAQIIVAGHSHKPLIQPKAGILYLNPGSAGPRRFSLPVTVALLVIEKRKPQAEIIRLL